MKDAEAAAIGNRAAALMDRRGVSPKKECIALGLSKNVTPHVLRHTTATLALANGMPIEEISKLLGHESIDTTMIYAHTSTAAVQAGHRKHIV